MASSHADHPEYGRRIRAIDAVRAPVSCCAAALGNMVSLIKSRGWWNDTLVVFSSDNGAPLDVSEAAGECLLSATACAARF